MRCGWRVPPGRRSDEDALWAKRPDARARISGALEQVETLSQADGHVIRLVRQTRGEAPPVTPEPSVVLPDSTLERLTRGLPSPPGPVRRFSWGKWSLRPRFAFMPAIAGRAGSAILRRTAVTMS